MTSALQESTANVDEWKRQLQLYKEENTRVKTRYADLEAGKIAEGNVEALRLRVEALENELRTRNEEIKAFTMATKNKDYMVCKKKIHYKNLIYKKVKGQNINRIIFYYFPFIFLQSHINFLFSIFFLFFKILFHFYNSDFISILSLDF